LNGKFSNKIINLIHKGLAEVVKVLVLIVFIFGLKFEFSLDDKQFLEASLSAKLYEESLYTGLRFTLEE
jgi:hypothetical protein